MAGRRERARGVVEVLVPKREEGRRSVGVEAGEVGGRRVRSSMKFPARRLDGVRGRWRWRVMS